MNISRWFVAYVLVALLSLGTCFGQPPSETATASGSTPDLVAKYNYHFERKEYDKALEVCEFLLTTDSQNLDILEIHRERAKMLAATNQQQNFIQEMLFIRNFNSPKNVEAFFSVLSHSLVPKALRDDLRRIFFDRSDTAILLSWPTFADEKVIDCSKMRFISRHIDNVPAGNSATSVKTPAGTYSGQEMKSQQGARIRIQSAPIDQFSTDPGEAAMQRAADSWLEKMVEEVKKYGSLSPFMQHQYSRMSRQARNIVQAAMSEQADARMEALRPIFEDLRRQAKGNLAELVRLIQKTAKSDADRLILLNMAQ